MVKKAEARRRAKSREVCPLGQSTNNSTIKLVCKLGGKKTQDLKKKILERERERERSQRGV